jgi:hypothetical protein
VSGNVQMSPKQPSVPSLKPLIEARAVLSSGGRVLMKTSVVLFPTDVFLAWCHHVAQAGLKHAILPQAPPKGWGYRCAHHAQLLAFFKS